MTDPMNGLGGHEKTLLRHIISHPIHGREFGYVDGDGFQFNRERLKEWFNETKLRVD
jgi:hypothetical protein